MPQTSTRDKTEPLIPLLEARVIPLWERHSLKHLAVTTATLSEFKRQSLPERMRTSVKKRIGKRPISASNRNFNNSNSYRKLWVEDNQAVFNYPALVFTVEGEADFHIADYIVHCPQDHFLLFRHGVPRPMGGQPHFDKTNTNRRHCAILWFFSPAGTNSVIAYICHSEDQEHWADGYHIVHRLDVVHAFQLFMQEVQQKPAAYEPIAISSFHTFLHLFLRELKEGHFTGGRNSALHTVPKAREASPVERAKQYVKNHLDQPLTTSQVARELGMSRNSFMQHFSRETGRTFHDFVTEERMAEAHRLLGEGYWSIAFVCRFIGLKPTRFRTQFKDHFGLTPSEFRTQIQIKGQKR